MPRTAAGTCRRKQRNVAVADVPAVKVWNGAGGDQQRSRDREGDTVSETDKGLWNRQRESKSAITRDRYDAVLLDLDGVITDTASVHAACWKELRRHGAHLVVNDLGELVG